MNDSYPETGLTEGTRKEMMDEVDRRIAAKQAIRAHEAALLAVTQHLSSIRKETWLVRQLKTMRVDLQLSGQDHYADVITSAIIELGGEV